METLTRYASFEDLKSAKGVINSGSNNTIQQALDEFMDVITRELEVTIESKKNKAEYGEQHS